MRVRLTDRALHFTECASNDPVRLKQCALKTALYCASGRSSLQVAIAMAVLTANDPEHRDDVRQMVDKLKTSGAALLREVHGR
jgi:hypothetical protein